MAPLSAYPDKPSKGETNGFDKLESYDAVVEQNIAEAYGVGSDAAQAAAEKVAQSDRAGLRTVGWGEMVFLEATDVMPVEADEFTLIIRDE